MSLITENWRLKLLAIGLAVLMLGAVTVAQNPPRTRTITVGLNYLVGKGLVLIDPPTKIDLSISGLADVIAGVTADNLVATADATNAKPGSGIKINVTAKSLISSVAALNPAPIAVTVDVLQPEQLLVQVVARAAPGWSLDKEVASCPSAPCSVNFTGPTTWEVNLTAAVVYASPVNVGVIDEPNVTVTLRNGNGLLDLSTYTVPSAGLDVTSASIHIEAHHGSTSSTVPLVDAPPSQPPPAGYRVSGITISPATVIVTGDAAAIGRIQRILLPAVDLSGRNTDFTIQVTIPYPDGVTGSVATATITYSISRNPNASPGP